MPRRSFLRWSRERNGMTIGVDETLNVVIRLGDQKATITNVGALLNDLANACTMRDVFAEQAEQARQAVQAAAVPEEGCTRCHCGAKYWDKVEPRGLTIWICASCRQPWDGLDHTNDQVPVRQVRQTTGGHAALRDGRVTIRFGLLNEDQADVEEVEVDVTVYVRALLRDLAIASVEYDAHTSPEV